MQWRLLTGFAALLVLPGCSSHIPPAPLYPKVEIAGVGTEKALAVFTASLRSIIAEEQSKAPDKLAQAPAIMSATDREIVVRCAPPASAKDPGYIKLTISPEQAGPLVNITGRLTYVRIPASGQEDETDLLTSGVVPQADGYVVAYQQVFDRIAGSFTQTLQSLDERENAGFGL